MKTLGANLLLVEKGHVKIECPFSDHLTQHHGFFHAGVITAIADNACGFSALTMMPENTEVLTVEFKINFIRPAISSKLIAIGKVVQSGKKLTICEGFVYDAGEFKMIAKMMATMIGVYNEQTKIL